MPRKKPLTRRQLFAQIRKSKIWTDQVEGRYCGREQQVRDLMRRTRMLRDLIVDVFRVVDMPDLIRRGIEATLDDVEKPVDEHDLTSENPGESGTLLSQVIQKQEAE